MSATVDERIVAAKFDASDFEKGVNKTIKKLDELKKSLDLKDTTKSVNELSEKVKTSTDSVSGSLDKLTNRLTTFTGMVKQNILSGLAQEVSDVFLKMERAVTNFIRSLGSEQVNAGMAKYEQMLSSVRTMMAAGESQDSAYSHIEELREYSDQTSYSLSQMTDALSKFRAAGVDLDSATKSVEGIANACATAGINAIDAQRAFYNLSQAYSTGSLKYTDYRSLELLNMTTEKFKQNLLEAAEEAGTLKRLSDGTYKTISKEGEKITKGKKVTLTNIQEALRYGFVTKDVMNKLFGGKYYFSEKEFRNYKKRYTDKNGNLTEAGRQRAIADAKKDFNEYAVEAYLAAREARNFTDVTNTLKDVVSTGWSTTFENLFGKLESATKFFTKLAEGPLAEVIYKIGEYRNAILGFFNGTGTDYEGSGAQMIQDIILNLSDAFGILLQTFQQILPGFEELNYEEGKAQPQLEALGKKLRDFTADVAAASLRIKEGVEAFNEWMNSPIFDQKEGPSRIEVIRQAISNLLSVFSIAYKLFEFGFNTVVKVVAKAAPIFDAVFAALEKITEPLAALNSNTKPFQDLEDSANNLLMILDPIIRGLTSVLGIVGEVGKFFAEMAIDTVTMNLEFFSDVLRFFIDLFTDGNSSQSLREGKSTLDGIREAFEGIKEACSNGLNAVKEFLGSLIKDIRQLFGLVDENGEKIQNGGVFENLKNFFDNNQFIKDAKAWVDQAVTDVSNFIKDIPNKIMKLGANIYDTLYKLFFTEETKYNGTILETRTVLTPLGKWMDQAIKDIKQFFIDLPDNIVKGVGEVFSWIDTIFNNWFGQGNTKKNEDAGKKDAKKEESEVLTRFNGFIDSIVASIKAWFDDLPNKIRKGLSSIGSFFSKLYAAVDEFLFGKKITKVEYLGDKNGKKYVKVSTTRIKSGFSKFLDDIIKEVKAFIIKIPEYVKEGIKGAGDIISAVVNALFGNNEDQNADPTKKVEEQIKKPFLGIDWTGIWNTIKDVGQTLINQVARIFTGTDNVEVNAEWFSNTVANGIDWIKQKAEIAFRAVEDFVISIPTRIAEWFGGEGKTEKEQDKGPVGKALLGFAESVGNFIANIPNVLLGFVTNAITEIGKLWQKLYDAIINPQKSDEPDLSMLSDPEKAYYSRYIDSLRKSHKTKSAWDKFVENLGKVISKAFEELPVWVAQGVDLAIAGLNELIGKIGNWFSGSESKQIQSDSKESTTRAMNTVAAGADAGANSSQTRLQAAFNNIGEHIKTLIITTLPKFISDAWTALKTLGSEIWAGFEAIFDDTKTVDTPVATAVRNLGNNVKKKIIGENGDGSDGLIAWINDAFIEIGKKGAEIWTGISNIFNGTPKTEFEEEVIKFGVWLGDFITIEIPKAIKKGFSAIAKLFNPTDSVEENLALLPDAERAYYSRYIDSLRKTNKKVEEETNKPGFWSFVSDIGDSLGKAFISVGPSILNGISTALEWLTHIGDILIDILSGKTDLGTEIEKAYGKEARPLKDALTRIGESIKKLLVETIPKMVGAAIVEINKYMTEAFSNLRTGMEEAAGEDGGSSKLFGDDDSFFGKIMNVFDQITQFATGDGAAIAMVVAFAYLLKQLKEAMSIADELEAATGVVKWSAITFAILGLSNILSSIMDVIKEGNPEKIAAAESIIDKLGGLLNSVAWIMGLMSASKIVTALNELFGGGKDGSIGKIKIDASKSKDAMINVTNTVEAVSEVSSFWSKGLGALTTGAGVGFGSYLAGAGIKAAVEDITDGLTTSLTELMTSVDMVSDLLTPFIEKLTAAGDKVENAKTAIDNIIELFKSMFMKFGNLYEDVGGQAIKDLTDTNAAAGYGTKNAKGEVIRQHSLASTSIAAFISDFSGIIDIYIAVANFIDSLSDALTKVGNVDSIDDKIKSITSIVESEAFSELIHKVFSNVYNLFTKLEGAGYNAVNYENLAQAFSVLADVMTIIAESMGGIDAETSKNFASGFDALKQLAEVFNGKDADLLKLGSRISSFGSHMRNFYKYVKEMEGFDAADVDATNAKVNSMVQIIKGVSDSVQNLSYYGEGFKFLPALGAYLPDLGTDLAGFIEQLNRAIPENISDDRLGTLSSVTSSLSAFLSSFGELGWLSKYNGFNYDDDYRKIIDSIYENLQSIINNPKNNQFGALAAQLYQIINNPLTSEEAYEQYRSAGSDIARELYAGIQAALDNPDNHYQPEIVPVLKLDGVDSQMRDYFTNHKFSPELDMTSVIGLNADTDAKLDEIKSALDSINESIVDLKNNTATTADVAKAIGGWTIKTNTGALVGAMTPAIDRAIGERIWLVQRRNTID